MHCTLYCDCHYPGISAGSGIVSRKCIVCYGLFIKYATVAEWKQSTICIGCLSLFFTSPIYSEAVSTCFHFFSFLTLFCWNHSFVICIKTIFSLFQSIHYICLQFQIQNLKIGRTNTRTAIIAISQRTSRRSGTHC